MGRAVLVLFLHAFWRRRGSGLRGKCAFTTSMQMKWRNPFSRCPWPT